MTLFDSRERKDVGPAVYGEPRFAYLQRTARPEFAAVRDLMEAWIETYPRAHRRDLARRLALTDDVHFEAAFFELYVYHLLRGVGGNVGIHPRLSGSSRRPDFVTKFAQGPRVLVEAVTVDEVSQAARASRSRLAQVYNSLNKVSAPDYFLHVEDVGQLRSPIPGRLLRAHVQSFIDNLDYDAVRMLAAANNLAVLPSTEFRHDGCTLTVSVIPVRPDRRGYEGHRPVGMIGPGEAYWVDHHTPIRQAVRKKAGHYGRLRRPFVIAVNAAGMQVDKDDIMQALFGTEQILVQWDPDPANREPRYARKRDGAFMGPKGPVNTRVSGVLVVSSLLPWTVGIHEPALYLNPWARYPVATQFDQLTRHHPIADQLVETGGQPVAGLLGLPKGWPFGSDPA